MKRVLFGVFVLVLLVAPWLRAQELAGDWQGALGTGKDRLRLILHVDKRADGGLKASVFSIDQGPDGMPVSAIRQTGAELTFSIEPLKLAYKGTLSPDGTSIVGRLRQDGMHAFTFRRATAATAWPRDIHCACAVSFAEVAPGVKLEVLDWGGTGRPVVLLAGLGDTAHGFDEFAHKLAAKYHVYGVTRRGFGESSAVTATEAGYDGDRLGDDVLAVVAELHLVKPVLVGHSIAGEELSSVGSRHPEEVAGLVYLEAAYGYAFYDPAHGDAELDAVEARRQLAAFVESGGLDGKSLSALLERLPKLEEELKAQGKMLAGLPAPPAEAAGEFGPEQAMMLGQRKYTKIGCPVLAIYADPHELGPMPEFDAAGRAAMNKMMAEHTGTHRSEFTAGVPGARVVAIPRADHYVFKSNEADVLREIDAFVASLPATK